MNFIELFNPLHYMSSEKYEHFWQYLFATLLQGFWIRFISLCLLGLSLWFGFRRRNFGASAVLFILTVVVAYVAPHLKRLF